MLLSVVIPVFDGAATLRACLDAALSALPERSEILVVDDGSTDGSGRIAREVADPRVHVLAHGANCGTSAARNTGWRAAAADLIAFVDADVVLETDALRRLVRALEQDPDLCGANGLYTLGPRVASVTDFATLSLHYQHRAHGERVASAFTALCVLRRNALEQMGGWDERQFSRYADDVSTRFHLPPRSIALVQTARARHLKQVRLAGLLRHRFNIGWFYLRSLRLPARRGAQVAGNAVLHRRYPLNTALAAATLVGLAFPSLLPVPLTGFLLVNLPFARFVAQERGAARALHSLVLSSAEGFSFLFGMAAALAWSPRDDA